MNDMRSPAEIERDIQVTRAEIDRTLDRLERKLSPGHLLDTALDGGGAFATNLGRTARDNPLPVMLLGCSLAWLAFGPRSPGTHGHSHTGTGVLSDTAHRMSQGARQTGGAVHGAAESMRAAGDRIAESAHAVREQGGRYYRSANRMAHENPLALGALGLAVGVTLAAMFPITRREEEAMGEQSDRVKAAAKDMAAEQAHRADAAAGAAVKAARQETRHPDSRPAAERARDAQPESSPKGPRPVGAQDRKAPKPAPGMGAAGPSTAAPTPGSGSVGPSGGRPGEGKMP